MNGHIDQAAMLLQAAADELERARLAARAAGDRVLALRIDTERRAAQRASERLYGFRPSGHKDPSDG